jgi:tetratricopeptide (TPR) repeat protein
MRAPRTTALLITTSIAIAASWIAPPARGAELSRKQRREVSRLLESARKKNPHDRFEIVDSPGIAEKLATYGTGAIPQLVKALGDKGPTVRWVAKHALFKIGRPAAPAVIEAARGGRRTRRIAALKMLSLYTYLPAAMKVLETSLKDRNEHVRAAARHTLAEIKANRASAAKTRARLAKRKAATSFALQTRKVSEYRADLNRAVKLMQLRKLNEAHKVLSAAIAALEKERELSGYAAAKKALRAAGRREKAHRAAMQLANDATARLGGAKPTYRDPKTGKISIPLVAQLNGQAKMSLLARAYFTRGGVWMAARKTDQAIADLNVSLERDPFSRRAYCLRGSCYERKRDYARAEKDYTSALAWGKTLRRKPDELTYQALCSRARVYSYRKMYPQALKDLAAAVAANKDRTEAYIARVQIWTTQRRHAELVKDYTQLLRLAKNKTFKAFALQSRAAALVKLGRYREGIADYSEVIKLAPGKAEIYYLRGQARNYAGDNKNALADLNKAVAARPKAARYLKVRGWAHLGLKSYDLAIADFDKVINRPSAGDPAALLPGPAQVPWDAYLGRGHCYRLKGEIAKGLSDYRQAVKRNPRHSTAVNTLAWILATHHDPKIRNGKDAVKYAEAAVKLSARRDPSHLDTLAAAYAESGRFKDAVRTEKEAVSKLRKEHGKALAEELAGHLKKFQAGKPHHEPKN